MTKKTRRDEWIQIQTIKKKIDIIKGTKRKTKNKDLQNERNYW